jgi:hypothetical protein
MNSALIWSVLLIIGVAAVFYGSLVGPPELYIALTALICLGFAVTAVWSRHRLVSRGGNEATLAADTARSMALVWAWAAFSLLFIYVFALSWIEWWQYFLGAGAIAGLCLFFAAMLARDAAAGREDQAMLKLARYLTIGQLVGMVAAMVGLVLDDKMPRSPDKPDWAASAIFFFGAASLAIISLNALRGTSLPKS